MVPPPLPAWLTGFLDDECFLPPTSTPLADAADAHGGHRRSQYAGLTRSLVVTDVKLPDLIDVLDDVEEPLPVTVLVTGGAGSIGPAVRWATRAPVLRLRGLELTLRDEDDLAHNAHRALTALATVEEELDGAGVFVELPRFTGEPSYRWLSALDEIAAAGVRAKFRTGGGGAPAPQPEDVAACFEAALDRELAYKCAGGLDRAVTDDEGFGALNLLAATRACLDSDDVVEVLREVSAVAVVDRYDAATLGRTRNWLTGVGVTDLLALHDDLVEIGLAPGR
ncbi:hypothetical protein ABIE44_003072 [Marmoricola sp. OAE513]|uniref:hypothetical protein n=1 Tax=Marmoricola sp. OAE513 TaxID=2817894 RepID=UPI001AEAA068